ncbi:LLM class flavin-dependent oxidoreductase [Marinivivus vitaminiproducens]|uniref:LLM class flavin-dependent oxidoreductase n=1 Tax=Marinivivus vitaminiproducens TaxID=3035935 RepID=UPI0027A3D191|nr:LLM class flavin-dependent oxidoreductase [Geminicoccaceae bacterium SCSIO 64248]
MHLTLSLSGYGFHPAGWRASSLMRESQTLPQYEALVRQAEESGLDAVLFLPPGGGPDYVLAGTTDAVQIDTLPLLGTMVPRTERIGLGASVSITQTEPFHTARAFAVLDNLSSGRTACIVDTRGSSHQAADFGHRTLPSNTDESCARTAEYLEVAQKLWDSWEDDAVVADKQNGLFADSNRIHPIHHTGRHFTVRGPLTAVRPIQGHPVLIMCDPTEGGLRLAASKADLFLAECQTLEDVLALRRGLSALAIEYGRPDGEPRVLMNVMPVLGETTEAAEARAAALDAIADVESASATCARFVGTGGDLAQVMAAWHAKGVADGFNILPAVLPDDVDYLINDTLPALRNRGLFRSEYAQCTLRGHLALPRPANRFALV